MLLFVEVFRYISSMKRSRIMQTSMENKMNSIIIISFAALAVFVFTNEASANPTRQRVIGGIDGDIGQFPYQVSIRKMGMRGQYIHICGGAIISPRHILTAAHCLVDVKGVKDPVQDMIVVSGTNVNVPGAGHFNKIKSTIHHPNYLGTFADSWQNDIAIFTLQKDIIFNALEQPLKLPQQDCKPDNVVVASGWGVLNYPNQLHANNIMRAEMKIVGHNDCQSVIGTKIHEGQLCAFAKKSVGLCVGDSGSPLVLDDTVVGVSSWVIPCAQGVPDVFSRVHYYIDWIKSVISKY